MGTRRMMFVKSLPLRRVFYTIIIFLLCVSVTAVIITFYRRGKIYAVKHISNYLQTQAEEHKQYGTFSWGKISITLIPLQVSIEDVKLDLKSKQNFLRSIQIDPLLIGQVIIGLDYLAFLNKKLSFKVTAQNAHLTVKDFFVNPTNLGSKKTKLQVPFFSPQFLSSFPVTHLVFQNTQLNYHRQGQEVKLKKWDMDIHATPSRVKIQSEASHMQVSNSLSAFFLSDRSADFKRHNLH